MTKRKDADLILEASKRNWECSVRSTVVLMPSCQRGPGTVLSGQNITLGIWIEGQVEPVRQLVAKILYLKTQRRGGK